jgi:hypothetical protein
MMAMPKPVKATPTFPRKADTDKMATSVTDTMVLF